MILVVAGRDALPGFPDRPVVRVCDGESLRAVEGKPDLVVVDSRSVTDGGDLVRSLVRDERYATVPLLILGDVTQGALREFDERLPASADQKAVSDAAERALAFSDYSEAVDKLYAECRDRAVEGAAPLERTADVTDALREADDLLGQCGNPSAALRALLSGSEGGIGSKDS